jgi:hypothetical protein
VQTPFTTKQELKHNTLFAANPAEAPLWGFATVRNVAAMYTAGLTLLYRHGAWMKGTNEASMHNANVGAAMFPINDGDVMPTLTPATAWGETAYLSGGQAWTTSVANYQWQETGWAQLLAPGGGALSTPTKTSLHIAPFGFMAAGSTLGGGVRSYQLFTKWASR